MTSEYSFSSKLLHHLTLGNKLVPEILFDVERNLYRSKCQEISEQSHVFISGFARAGTTILMRSLYESGQFSSLTYRDMPFVLAPNLWNKLSAKSLQQMEASQRAHGDGIDVDFNSPEALEEVFWRIFCGKDYIRDDHLLPHNANQLVLENYRDYIHLLCHKYSQPRYLSKNNNNILRIDSLLKAFPHAYILIPFRNPVQHAFSLLKQHELFTDRHSTDSFSKHYMTWLVHHEFGGDHRPFQWGKANAVFIDSFDLNYWLYHWLSVYRQLFDKHANNQQILFIDYELLCLNTEKLWSNLNSLLKLNGSFFPQFTLKEKTINHEVDSSLHNQADALYSEMKTLCEKTLLT